MTLGSYRLSGSIRWLSEAKSFLDTSRNLALRSPGYTRRFRPYKLLINDPQKVKVICGYTRKIYSQKYRFRVDTIEDLTLRI